MYENLEQEQIDIYASNATAIDKPQGTNYTQGVKVGRTIPAKWWNWLFNAVTKSLRNLRYDSQHLLDEVKNTVTGAGLTPHTWDNTQMAQAAQIYAERAVINYVDEKKRGFFYRWSSSNCLGSPNATYVEYVVKPVRYASTPTFLLVAKYHYTGGSDQIGTYVSHDLLNWYRARSWLQTMNVDCVYFKGSYYLLAALSAEHKYQLFSSTEEDLSAGQFRSRKFFNEYGGAVGLRVTGDSMWLISASANVYSDTDYHSYYTLDGNSWVDAGEVFRNTNSVEDSISEVIPFDNGYIIGNMFTADGLTWRSIISDWAYSAYCKTFITYPSGTATLNMQFNATEGQWYRLAKVGHNPSVRTGTYELMGQWPDGMLAGRNTVNGKLARSDSGYSFVDCNILYPDDPKAELFTIDDWHFIGNYKSQGRINWIPITLPEEASIIQYSGVGCCIIAGNFFSGDKGETWAEGTCLGDPYCAKPILITDDLTCMSVVLNGANLTRRVTFNGVNRVIGTTLYLK